jgi:hypothetical protein
MQMKSNPYEFPFPEDRTVEARHSDALETERFVISRKVFFNLVLALGIFIGMDIVLALTLIVLLTKGL